MTEQLDKAYDDMLKLFDNPGFVKMFNDHIQLSIAHTNLQNHWWTKLGRFLRVL